MASVSGSPALDAIDGRQAVIQRDYLSAPFFDRSGEGPRAQQVPSPLRASAGGLQDTGQQSPAGCVWGSPHGTPTGRRSTHRSAPRPLRAGYNSDTEAWSEPFPASGPGLPILRPRPARGRPDRIPAPATRPSSQGPTAPRPLPAPASAGRPPGDPSSPVRPAPLGPHGG